MIDKTMNDTNTYLCTTPVSSSTNQPRKTPEKRIDQSQTKKGSMHDPYD